MVCKRQDDLEVNLPSNGEREVACRLRLSTQGCMLCPGTTNNMERGGSNRVENGGMYCHDNVVHMCTEGLLFGLV